MDEKPTALDLEIEKLNAYRQLTKKLLPIKGVSPDTIAAVNIEFAAWVEERILALLGKESPKASVFSSDEVEILKGLVAQVKARGNKPAPTPMPTKGQTVGAAPAPKAPAEALNPGLDTKAYNEQQKRILVELNRLAEMDRNGPEF